MNIEIYANFLLSHIPGSRYASGNSEILCRCMFCGDSVNKDSAHLYFNLPWDQGKPLYYKCFKCNSKGIVSSRFLLELDIYDPVMANDVNEYNKRFKYKGLRVTNTQSFNYNIYNVIQTNTNGDLNYKRDYINGRLGTNLSLQDIMNLKIVLNLFDLFSCNKIEKFTRSQSVLNQLNQYFIGFISTNNSYLNMRQVYDNVSYIPTINERYINYKLFDYKNTVDQKFYTIPCTINLLRPGRVKLHLAEGPFDILSIYLNLRHMEEGIYSSITGNSYIATIMYFLEEKAIPNLEIHFYVDNDKYGTRERILNIIREIPDPTIPAYLHRNVYPGEKDFGVPLNKIREEVSKLR